MVNRKDFRPSNKSSSISDNDRKIIQLEKQKKQFKQQGRTINVKETEEYINELKDKKNLKDSQIFSSQTNTTHNSIYVNQDRKSRDKTYIHDYNGNAICKDNTRKGEHYYSVYNHNVLYGGSIEIVQRKLDKESKKEYQKLQNSNRDINNKPYLTESETENSSETLYAIRNDDNHKALYFRTKKERDTYFNNEFSKHELMNSHFFKESGKAHNRKFDLGE